MAYSFPRDPIVEWYLDGWRDISTDVRQSPALQVTQGRRDWSTKTPPCGCKFTLDDGPDHGDGDYNPENPLGEWFEQLDRNVPLRVADPIAADTFTRTVVDGWGTSDSGDVWSNAGGVGGTVQGSDWQVAGGVGTQSVPAANGYRYSTMAGDYRNVTVAATVTVPITNITGGSLEPANVIVRRLAGVYYMARVVISSAEAVTISIHHSIDGQLVAPVTVTGLVDAVSNKVLRVMLQAEEETIRAKVYAPGAEPLDWHVEVDDDRIVTAGQVGVRNGVASGNTNTKPIVFSVDDVVVSSPRFAGEVVKMVPKTSLNHSDDRTEVEAAGIRRRLSKGERKLATALERYITRGDAPFGVADFWPLDREQDAADRGLNTVAGGNRMEFYRATGGAIKWGTPTGLLPVDRGVTLVPPPSGSGQMLAYTSASKFNGTDGWGFLWQHRVSTEGQASMLLDLSNSTQLFLKFEPGIAILQLLPAATTLMTIGVPLVGDDAVWHTFALGCRQSGGNILYHLTVDDDSYEVSAAGTVGLPRFVLFSAFPGQGFTYEVTQVLAITNDPLTGSPWHAATARSLYLGRPGETAGDRFTRLCGEESVPYMLTGYPTDTPAMGPQRPLTLMKLVDECLDAAQGSAYEPLGTTGLAIRTLRSASTQDPALTLNYSDKTIAETFGPTRDDQGILNDVTAKRPNGGEYRVEQATGPNNTADPGTAAGAAGRVDTDVTVNVRTDPQLIDQAGWRVHMGTVPGPRFPTVTVNLSAPAFVDDPDLTAAVLDVGIDDLIVITNVQARRIYDDVRLIVRGWTETIDTNRQHKIVFNTTPASPYDTAIYDDADSKYDSDTSTVAADFVAGTGTSLSVATTSATLWTLRSSAWPFQVKAGGVVLNVTAVSGTSSPQSFTVDATPVNGVAKTITAGTSLRLARTVYMTTQRRF